MLLLQIRQPHAGDRDPERWPDDRDRPLTDKGRKTQRDVSRFLRKRDLVPTLVLASPWARAAETAEILAHELSLPNPPVPCPALAAAPDLARLAQDIGTQGAEAVVALVGHSPWMEELAGLLLTGSGNGVRMDYPKSGVMAIEAEQAAAGTGALRFFLRPKMV
jgi:phosphohistidine phosphatase